LFLPPFHTFSVQIDRFGLLLFNLEKSNRNLERRTRMRLSDFSSHNWLTPREKRNVIENLIGFEADLIKWDNKRQLPLKSGGKTDIYVNLRNARNCPRALPYIASIYRNPLTRLGVKSFVEVPDSVSCFAGHLSEMADLPYVTIREQAKAGREIGRASCRERV